MAIEPSRRRFLLSATATGVAVGLHDLRLLRGLPPVGAAEARLDSGLVRYSADIEPTVRFLEETPRDAIIERLLARIKKDLSYRELLAALLLAGIRNIPGAELASHRNVGGHLHSVLVVHSAHLASLASSADQRWLPILWAVDRFKFSQSRPFSEGRRPPSWHMEPVDERAVPPAHKAPQAFADALDNWDEEAVDAAAAGLARSAGANQVFEILSRYAARDFRYLGHKAIHVANSWRTLRTIGWHHAEPVLRSLGRALAAYFRSEGHPEKREQLADRAWRHNRELAATIQPGWQVGKLDSAATSDLLSVLRVEDDLAAGDAAAAMLNRQIDPQSIWDAVLCGMAEVVMADPGFNTVHAVTSANAIRFAYQTCGDDETRRRLLLQAASFVPLFNRDVANRRRAVEVFGMDKQIGRLQARPLDGAPEAALDEIFADAGNAPLEAAGKTLTYLAAGGDSNALAVRARRLVFRKGDDHHDYKYSSAVFEDYLCLSPPWRDRYLAAAMFQLRGSTQADTALAERLKTPG